MDTVLAELPHASRIAVVRLRSLGDCVLTTPALEILKRARPDLRVAVMVEERFRAVFEGNPDVDEILAPKAGAMSGWRPVLCLNFHGGTRSAWLTALSRARWRAGFAHFRHAELYNVKIPRAQDILGIERKVHTAEHLASAIFYLGAPICEVPRAKLAGPLPDGRGSGSGLAVIHPFAATPEKTWPTENFLAVANHLASAGLDPIFIGAASDDFSPFRAYRKVQAAPLDEIKNLLASASLFIGNDSGPAHMAAAFGLPVVAIFSASDPEIWGPWRTASEIVLAPASPAQVIEALARLGVPA